MSSPAITLEEHFLSSCVTNSTTPSFARWCDGLSPPWKSKLSDISPNGSRIHAMEAGGATIQVLSHLSGISSCSVEEVVAANNELAAATKAQPRFQGFAALPMRFPREAAIELERCIQRLSFVGTMVDCHVDDGRYYDDAAFWEVFGAAERLDVPVYLHPTIPTEIVDTALFKGNYGPNMHRILGIAGWGWHCDTALAVLRMYAAGVFERFPNLKVVLGHMGEMLPFMLDRIDEKMGQMNDGLKVSFREVWDRNIYVTTSGMFSMSSLACLVRCTKIDRILYSIDYPFSDIEQGKEFLKQAQISGLLTGEQLEMIAYKNAEELLKIKA